MERQKDRTGEKEKGGADWTEGVWMSQTFKPITKDSNFSFCCLNMAPAELLLADIWDLPCDTNTHTTERIQAGN